MLFAPKATIITAAPPEFGLTRQQTLTQPARFAGAFQAKRSVSGAIVRIHHARATMPDAVAALGIVASKKLLRTSVRRNAAKRQIRESFRLHQHEIAPADYVVRVLTNAKTERTIDWARALRQEIDQLWRAKAIAKGAP